MFKHNYLEEIPVDVIDIIDKYTSEVDYNIYVKTYRDYFTWRVNNFIDDRMHKIICRFNYAFKAGENSKDFLNRDIIANKKLEEHIITMIKYMKLPKIKKILRKNFIYNAKKVYERNNPNCKKNIDCYERELLAEYIISGYYVSICVRKIQSA